MKTRSYLDSGKDEGSLISDSTLKIYKHHSSFILESGRTLENLEIAYHSFGKLNEDRSNVVWICHALTGNSNPLEWWPELVGESKTFDPRDFFIVCANVIGSPYGSTNPLSLDCITQKSYFSNFPLVTIRDMARAHVLLRKFLGLDTIGLLIGASMGGQQAIEWSILEPTQIKKLVLIATNCIHSPYAIAFNESQRLAIASDETFKTHMPEGGKLGLIAARSIAMLSYRSYESYNSLQRNEVSSLEDFGASTYQRHQGQKLANRFDAYSYYALTKSMDSHNIQRSRGPLNDVLKTIKASTLCISINSDQLFPPIEQELISANVNNSFYVQIDSKYGHDGFLVECHKIASLLRKYKFA